MTDDGRHFTVVLSYDTFGDDPHDALNTALAAIASESGFFVEIYSDESPKTTEVEGDISEFRCGVDLREHTLNEHGQCDECRAWTK